MSSALFSGMIIAAIVMISPALASTDACREAPEALHRFEPIDPPKPGPEAAFFANGETEQTLADFRRQGVVMNFWATWCAPCVREMPALDRLAAALADANIKVLALSADRAGAEIVRKFYAKNDITQLPVIIDERSAVARDLGISGLPTTVLFDPEGREVGRVLGVAEWDAPEVVDYLRRCLAPGGSEGGPPR